MKIDKNYDEDFINDLQIENIIQNSKPDRVRIREILQKGVNKERLTMEESAILLNNNDPDLWQETYKAAKELKEKVYGNRMVLFAPLYVGNQCINGCLYCGFSCKNSEIERVTLQKDELKREVESLVDMGHKRTILVYGETPEYDGKKIADDIGVVYSVKKGKRGEIRRVNINAAPMDVDNFRFVKDAGIGTWQIFQETYHHQTYKNVHPIGPKSFYQWRLTGLDRAFEAGIDDVGIGTLLGLYNYKFEVLGLLQHTLHLEQKFGVGPHTISFPRLNPAFGFVNNSEHKVSDEELKKVISVLRLSVPYTGLILTAREPAALRRELFKLGVSQTDAGTSIEMKGYSKKTESQDLAKEQFKINDVRSLEEIISELSEDGYVPSFCTGCYRAGRTGEHFMEFSIPGFIHNFCKPNALLTFGEYLADYASETMKEKEFALIKKEMEAIEKDNPQVYKILEKKMSETKEGVGDNYL